MTDYLSSAHSEMSDVVLWEQAAGGDAPIRNSAQDYRMLIDAAFPIAGGIAGGGKVSQPAGGGTNVDIAPGYIILPSSYAGGGKYLARIDATLTIGVGAWSSGTLYTRITAKALDKADGGDSDYGWQITTTSSSSLPSVPAGSVNLGYLTRTSGAAITNAMLTKAGAVSVAPGTNVCRIWRSILSTVTAGSVVPLDNESWDLLGGHNTTNPGRYTAQIAGKYHFPGMIRHDNTAPAVCTATFYHNGSSTSSIFAAANTGSSSIGTPITVGDTFQMAVGDYVDIRIDNTTNVATAVNGSFLNVIYVGP